MKVSQNSGMYQIPVHLTVNSSPHNMCTRCAGASWHHTAGSNVPSCQSRKRAVQNDLPAVLPSRTAFFLRNLGKYLFSYKDLNFLIK